jgi:isopenicillin-N epimerase
VEPLVKPGYSDHARHWMLDPQVVFLNHGSFGACPLRVIERQRHLHEQMEREPVRFMVRELEGLIDGARAALGAFIGADPAGVALVPNATAAVNAIVRSLNLGPGDEILTNNHEYNACNNVLRWTAERAGATVVTAEIPLPVRGAEDVTSAIMARVTDRTRLIMVSHVTSPTALVFPVEEIVAAARTQGVDVLVDGAHAPGMLPLRVDGIGAAYYVGNCHKWMCAPKGAGFLVAEAGKRDGLVPAVISHALNSTRTDRSRFHQLFDWTGTDDFSAWLAIPEAIATMEAMLPGGWAAVMRANREKALAARALLFSMLDCEPLAPDGMIGTMAAVRIPDARNTPPAADDTGSRLYDEFGVQVPIIGWPAHPKRLMRISGQLYNTAEQYEYAGRALRRVIGA